MNASTKNLETVLQKSNSENEARQVALETVPPANENTLNRLKAKVLYEPSYEHSLATIKTASNFSETKEIPNGDIFWKGRSVEKLGGSRLQNGEGEDDISTDFRKVFIDATEDSVTKLNETDTKKYRSF